MDYFAVSETLDKDYICVHEIPATQDQVGALTWFGLVIER